MNRPQFNQYSHVLNDEEGLEVVARDRAMYPGLSGFEKHLIETNMEIAAEVARHRTLKNGEFIYHVHKALSESGYPTTVGEIMSYMIERKDMKNREAIQCCIVGGLALMNIRNWILYFLLNT